jgi:hypothetical protein
MPAKSSAPAINHLQKIVPRRPTKIASKHCNAINGLLILCWMRNQAVAIVSAAKHNHGRRAIAAPAESVSNMFRIQQISKRRHILAAGVAALAAVLVLGASPADASSRGFGNGGKSFNRGGFNNRVAVGPRAVYRSGSVNARSGRGWDGRHGKSWASWNGNNWNGNHGNGNNWNGNHWNGNGWNGGFGGKGFKHGLAGPKFVSGRNTYSYFGPYGGGFGANGFRGYGRYGYSGYGLGRYGYGGLGYAGFQPYSYSYGGLNPYYGYPYGRFDTFGGVPINGVSRYGGYFAPNGVNYSGGAKIISVGAAVSSAAPQGVGDDQTAQAQETCQTGEYCIVRLGTGYNAPKIITLNTRDNQLAPEPVN